MNDNTLTVKDILDGMTKIRNESAHIAKALEQLYEVQSKGPGDIAAQAKAMAIADVAKCRETTLQQMLAMYSKMYDDLQNEAVRKIQLIRNVFDSNMSYINDCDGCEDDKLEALGDVTIQIKELVEKVLFEKKTEN